MKQLFGSIVIILSLALPAAAEHLKGGWIQYTYIGPGVLANTSRYEVTVRQYMECGSGPQQRDNEVFLGVFDGVTNQLIRTITILKTGSETLNKTTYSPCVTQPPRGGVCYLIESYTTTIELADNTAGYTLAVQRCCRISGIRNLGGNTNDIGITYTTKIPGTINGVNYASNKNPVFAQKDTALVCFNAPFTFDFSATDADGDQLTYQFCNGITGGTRASSRPNPPSNPPYTAVPYNTPAYSGSSPMGAQVTIDPQTGIISGTAPATTGDYSVAVCVNEYRNGVLIGTTRKEIHITVADCSLAGASLDPVYITCDGFTMNFENRSTSSNITSYLWDFGEKNVANPTSALPTPSHTYADSGMFTLKLKVTSTGGCQDSTTAKVKVFPGFVPDFNVQGSCFINAFTFTDATRTSHGVVNSWRWNLGDATTLADTATRKDTAWKYATPQTVQVQLIVTNSKGCIDTVVKPVIIPDKPTITAAFRDTLICNIDTLSLRATTGSGTITWVPQTGPNQNRILNANTANPKVFPLDTTTYIVTVNDNGCIDKDTVRVNVLPFIKVEAGLDTVICRTDPFNLSPVSDALSYQWQASTNEAVSPVKYPLVQPLSHTMYYVIANLGKCQDRDSVFVRVAPYPIATINADTMVCFGDRAPLRGSITGAAFAWMPTATLINANTLNPTAGPSRTTAYILTAIDTAGCNKPARDTVLVTVIPPVSARAGRDTSVAANQPLQLSAGGGRSYHWRPTTGLNDPEIANPVATLPDNIDSVRYIVRVSDLGGCYAEDDIIVRVFKSGPDIFVPTAFTPNGDGKNDVLRPLTVGISKLLYFRIYNRWGQLLFNTTETGKGWDGSFRGIHQPSNTYVYMVYGTDYLGKTVFRKGTVVLIR